MGIWDYATDVRLFVAIGIVLALCIGSLGDIVAELSIIILILQMTAPIHGLHIKKDEFRKEFKPSLISFVCCFGICSISALAVGVFFIDSHEGMWYGWVMLAAAPSAVSVVTIALMMRGNMAMTMISMVLIYGLALLITPLMTHILIGDAISPLEILKYIVLFIAIPVIVNIPLNKFHIEKKYKVTFINFMMLLLMLFSLGKNRDFIFENLEIVAVIIICCVVRTFGIGILMFWWMKTRGKNRENAVVYIGYAVWKNSGLATSMCMILLKDIPEAALPCAISLVIEAVWFAISNKWVVGYWPADEKTTAC